MERIHDGDGWTGDAIADRDGAEVGRRRAVSIRAQSDGVGRDSAGNGGGMVSRQRFGDRVFLVWRRRLAPVRPSDRGKGFA